MSNSSSFSIKIIINVCRSRSLSRLNNVQKRGNVYFNEENPTSLDT